MNIKNIFSFLFGKSKKEENKNDVLAKTIEEEQKAKEVELIKKEKAIVEERANLLADKMNKKEKVRDKFYNKVCICGSTNVVEKFKRIQGSIEGEISGHGYSSLFSGKSSLNGWLNGSIDTNVVNHCNDCGHEWKKIESEYYLSGDAIEKTINYIIHIGEKYYNYLHVSYDPLDKNEKYFSIDEKKNAAYNEYNEINQLYYDDIVSIWKEIHFVTLEAYIDKLTNSRRILDYKWRIANEPDVREVIAKTFELK